MSELVADTEELEATRRFLPLQPNALVGRGKTVQRVRAALLRPGCHLLTLLGPGGIGKTRVALAAVETLEDEFQDGVYFVDLTQIHDAADFPSLIIEQLGLQMATGTPLERVAEYL